MSRLVAVLGYSDRRSTGLHPVCAARLRRAEAIVEPGDVVLLSGWARHGGADAEATLMAGAWTVPARRLVLDPSARTTAGNAIGIARVARALGADQVVVVTSSWRGRRARTLTRAALARSMVDVELVTTDEVPGELARIRELACWSLVPVLAALTARAG